jgi:hypothetical protein
MNINTLERDEVVELNSGELISINRYGLLEPRLPSVGAASVSLSYRNIPDLKWGGATYNDPDLMALVHASTPLSLTSNTVRFER